MSIGQQILFFISLLGAFNGFVLSLYLFISKRIKSVATLFLGILLLVLSIRVAHAVFRYFNTGLSEAYCHVGLASCFLIGPTLYYFSKSVLTKVAQIPASWKWSWGLQLGFIVLVSILLPYHTFPWAWDKVLTAVIYAQWVAYVAATGFLFKDVIKSFFTRASGLKAAEKFWLPVYFGNCIIMLVYLGIPSGIIQNMCMGGPISFSFFLYLTIFLYTQSTNKGIIEQLQEADQPGKAEKRKIAESDALAWIEKLEKAVLDKELYKDPNLKLGDLAQKINISTHQLSQLLNDNLGKSFSTYINEYRIREACKLITTDDRLTLEAIGYEVGYNSKSTFYTAFKKVTDTTPALFKESMEKNNIK